MLDAARDGLVTTIDRDDERFVVISADRLRRDLAALRPSRASAVAEGGGWAVILPGLPVQGDGETFEEALDDALGGAVRHQVTYKLPLPDGRILRTRVSRPVRKETYVRRWRP